VRWRDGGGKGWSEIRISKSEIRNPKSEIRNPKSEIRNPKSETNPKYEMENVPNLAHAK